MRLDIAVSFSLVLLAAGCSNDPSATCTVTTKRHNLFTMQARITNTSDKGIVSAEVVTQAKNWLGEVVSQYDLAANPLPAHRTTTVTQDADNHTLSPSGTFLPDHPGGVEYCRLNQVTYQDGSSWVFQPDYTGLTSLIPRFDHTPSSNVTDDPVPDPNATLTPLPRRPSTQAARATMHAQWNQAIRMVTPGSDSMLFEARALHVRPGTLHRETDVSPIDGPTDQDVDLALPPAWETTPEWMNAAINDNIRLQDDLGHSRVEQADGAESVASEPQDGVQSSIDEHAAAVIGGLCDVLHDARAYYKSYGGYVNDLTFTLASENDPSCTDYPMKHPYSTTVVRSSTAATRWSDIDRSLTISKAKDAAGRSAFMVRDGDQVTVIEHRVSDIRSQDECRITAGKQNGWLPCSSLRRLPVAGDG